MWTGVERHQITNLSNTTLQGDDDHPTATEVSPSVEFQTARFKQSQRIFYSRAGRGSVFNLHGDTPPFPQTQVHGVCVVGSVEVSADTENNNVVLTG